MEYLTGALGGLSSGGLETTTRFLLDIDQAHVIDLFSKFRDAKPEKSLGAIAAYAYGAFNIKPIHTVNGIDWVFHGVAKYADDAEGRAVGMFGKMNDTTLIGLGDPEVKKLLDIPTTEPAVDILGVSDNGKFILADSKGGNGGIVSSAEFKTVIEQLKNTIARLKAKVTAPEFDRLQVAVPNLSQVPRDRSGIFSISNIVDPRTGAVIENVVVDAAGKPQILEGVYLRVIQVQ